MQGPPDELRDLYVASSRRLVAAIAAVTGSLDEAEEAVAEAFARATARWGRLRGYDDPEGWIRRVALNVARSRWRRSRRAMGPAREPVSAALSEDHVAVLHALARLPQAQREAIALHYLLDLSVEETARLQQVAIGTVKARLSRGRVRLADLLATDDTEVPSR